MANAEIFKTVFKGYSKEEVVAYIEQLNQKSLELQNELAATKARLEQVEEERLEDARETAQKSADEAALREAIIAELTPVLRDQIRAQALEELRPALEKELRRKIEEELTPKYEEIVRTEISNRTHHQAGELQELRRRAHLYDENREVLAELMIKAKNDAADIIRDAEEHARDLREEAEQRFRLLIADYELLKSNLLNVKSEAGEKLGAAIKMLDEFEKNFSCADQDVAHSRAHLSESN